MRLVRASPRIAVAMLLLAAILSGCQRAERYGPRPSVESPRRAESRAEKPKSASVEPLDPEIQWIDVFRSPKPDVLIEFVHAEKAPEEWAKLPRFWNAPALTKPDRAAALIGSSPLVAGALASGNATVKIKVPLGLPDPREYLPAGDPLTLGKWQVGHKLFFDDSWLEAKRGTSCASCHQPSHGFADRENVHPESYNTPTLVNCVFNNSQFWDGRAGRLEEVIQRTLEDERETDQPKKRFRHTWSGVIGRLRAKVNYRESFNKVFGKPPDGPGGQEQANITQDTVGRGLAAYLRTILSGNSIHDRAVREQLGKHSPTLKAEHYEAVLDDAALKELERAKDKKADVAADLIRGYLLFSNRDETRPMHCFRCHSGRTFTDNGFHNLGVGRRSRPGEIAGRFAQVPIGQKNRYLIDAYKTPTLRNLPRTGPYFHNGEQSSLREVVEFYNQGAKRNLYLDPELIDKNDRTLLGLSKAEIDALVLFLNALNGDDVDPVIKTPPSGGK